MASRTGRQLQRDDDSDRVQIAGCIPYRFRKGSHVTLSDKLEVLLITSLNGQRMKFPERVRELDENLQQAAFQESLVGAGVFGEIENVLGKWDLLGEKFAMPYEVYMFPLRAIEELELWPEKDVRKRVWMTVAEAREACKYWWMIEALNRLVERVSSSANQDEEEDDDTQPMLRSHETAIDIEPDNSISDHGAHGRRKSWSQKVSLEWIFVITNFILELPSAVLDQLSSEHKPQYALFAMLISFAALLISIVEFIYKGRKEKVSWRWKGMLPWLYYPLQNHKPFGSFKDIIGSLCALCQCIFTVINYSQSDQPIKITVWPVVFAFGLLCSKILESPERRIIP